MNPIISYLLEVVITLGAAWLVVSYVRPHLKRILLDLCGTDERAQFWTVFANLLLIGMPLLIALAYQPEARNAEELFFEIMRKLSGNLSGFLAALVCTGLMIAFFALFAPRTSKTEAK